MKKTKAKKNLKKLVAIILISIVFLSFSAKRVNASIQKQKNNLYRNIKSYEIDINNKLEVSEIINNLMLTINSEGINKNLLEQIFDLYIKISEKYTNIEISDMIEENAKKISENNIKKREIKKVIRILNRFDTKDLRKIVKEIDINEILDKIQNGESIYSIIKNVTNDFSFFEKLRIIVNVVFSKNILIVLIILYSYRTLLRSVIYKKAHEKAWKALIPIYRNITMLKICSMSPWWLLLLFIPVIGWIILILVSVASKFMLAESFGKGSVFAFGLWLVSPIFETILVFSKKTKYIGIEE